MSFSEEESHDNDSFFVPRPCTAVLAPGRDDRYTNENIDPMLHRLENVMPLLVEFLPQHYEPITTLNTRIRKQFRDIEFNYNDSALLVYLLALNDPESMAVMHSKLSPYIKLKKFSGKLHYKAYPQENQKEFSLSYAETTDEWVTRNMEESLIDRTIKNPQSLKAEGWANTPSKELVHKMRELQMSEEREAKMRMMLERVEADRMNEERNARVAAERLEETQVKLTDFNQKLTEASEELEKSREENVKLHEELDLCHRRSLKCLQTQPLMLEFRAKEICQNLLQDMKEAQDAELMAKFDLEKREQEYAELEIKVKSLLAERDKLQEQMEAAGCAFNHLDVSGKPSLSTSFSADHDVSMPVIIPATINRSRMLCVRLEQYQQMKQKFEDQKIYLALDQIIENFENMCKDTSKVTTAKEEIKKFRDGYGMYMATLEYNIKMMMENRSMSLQNLLPMPEPPNWSEMTFVPDYEQAMKQSVAEKIANKPLECVICIMDMRPKEIITKCGGCMTQYHRKCIMTHIEKTSTCPVCQTTLRK